jgi:hypothetical protein
MLCHNMRHNFPQLSVKGHRFLARSGAFIALFLTVTALPAFAAGRTTTWQQRIEADWVLSEELALQGMVDKPITT